MKKILVTGGPVHAYLDAVKIITNRFRGGLMCQLADALASYGAHVTYLCAPSVGATMPKQAKLLEHRGFREYHREVLDRAPSMDAVILGAAVANLIPLKPYEGKFPSHNYKPGDVIPIDFTIAPRVIDKVKKVAPQTQLFGYKLLSGVSHDELIRAAYGIVRESGATAVFANDTNALLKKYAVTKERGVHPVHQEDLAKWIWEMISDEYYSTKALIGGTRLPRDLVKRMLALIGQYNGRFPVVDDGLIFGTVAMRHDEGFLTTGRGKRELDSFVCVSHVDHTTRRVYTWPGKASLNAPLLDRMFQNPAVQSIVHYHEQVPDLPTHPYAPPGTVRDTERPNTRSFNIQGHGCILLLDAKGRQV